MSVKTDYTRDDLIWLCEDAVVHVGRWSNRDTPGAQEGIGRAWAFLRAGCPFVVRTAVTHGGGCVTNERTIWIEITHPVFGTFDHGAGHESETFYLPTRERLAGGGDWY